MSGRSDKTSSVRSEGGSARNGPDKLHLGSSGEEKIMLAAEESKDRLYEPKRDKKMVRVLTVVVYVFSVSLAAIMLSLYYVFFWEPKGPHYVKPKVSQVDLSADALVPRAPSSPPCQPAGVPAGSPPVMATQAAVTTPAQTFNAPSSGVVENYTDAPTDTYPTSTEDYLLENETSTVIKINSKRKKGRDPEILINN